MEGRGRVAALERVLGELRDGLARLYGPRLKRVILYGSWARGDATEGSDIDIVVVLGGRVLPGREIDRMLGLITELNLRHGVLLSVVPASERAFETLRSPLLINVRREGIPA